MMDQEVKRQIDLLKRQVAEQEGEIAELRQQVSRQEAKRFQSGLFALLLFISGTLFVLTGILEVVSADVMHMGITLLFVASYAFFASAFN